MSQFQVLASDSLQSWGTFHVPVQNILSKVTESLGQGWEVMAGVRPSSHCLTTLLHHAIHNPTMWKNLPLQLHRPGASVKGVVFPAERQSELQNIPSARSAHTIKLFPYHFTRPSPHTANPFCVCLLFYYPLTCVTARKGTQHFHNTHRLQGPKNTEDCLAALSKKSRCTTMLAVTQGSSRTPGHSAAFTGLLLGAKQLTKAVTEAEATWPRAAPNVTKGILPRLSLRGLGKHLLAENNIHICCCSTSRSYLLS